MIASRTPIAGADVADHYDELDAFYREVWGEHVHHGLWIRGDESRTVAVRQLAEMVAREAAISRGSRVIDIGCGYGATARLFAAEYGAEVTAITISSAQHAVAVKTVGAESTSTVNYLLGDWLENELTDSAFDAAISIESSEHMPDKPRFFAQAARVLRPGGRLVICAWLSAESPTPRQTRWLIEPIAREGRMPHLGSESDYRQFATDAGFIVERVQDVTRQIARTWPMIIRTFLGKLVREPAYLRFLCDPHAHNRIFALTTVRLWLAFRTGAMRYCVFTLRKE